MGAFWRSCPSFKEFDMAKSKKKKEAGKEPKKYIRKVILDAQAKNKSDK